MPDPDTRLHLLILGGTGEAVALATLAGSTEIDVAIFDRQGALIGRAGP